MTGTCHLLVILPGKCLDELHLHARLPKWHFIDINLLLSMWKWRAENVNGAFKVRTLIFQQSLWIRSHHIPEI
jgi:hypothetical protein